MLSLGTARYHRIESGDMPSGCATVPVIMNYGGWEVAADMVAGSMGIRLSTSDEKAASGFDTMQPGGGWWMMYEVKEVEASVHGGEVYPKM